MQQFNDHDLFGEKVSVHGCLKAVHGCLKAVHGCLKAVHGCLKAVHGCLKAVHGCLKAYISGNAHPIITKSYLFVVQEEAHKKQTTFSVGRVLDLGLKGH